MEATRPPPTGPPAQPNASLSIFLQRANAIAQEAVVNDQEGQLQIASQRYEEALQLYRIVGQRKSICSSLIRSLSLLLSAFFFLLFRLTMNHTSKSFI